MTAQGAGAAEFAAMPAYDREQWEHLTAYWEKRADARGTPRWLAEGARSAGGAIAGAARSAGSAVGKVVPDAVKSAVNDAGDVLLEQALRPAAGGAAHLLELTNDWAVELHDPEAVLKIARERGVDATEIGELRAAGLKDCDRLLTRTTLRWRTVGAVEGAAMGTLALVPVAGIPVAVFADVLVMDVLSVSIATRIAYSYGYDANDPAEREFIDQVVASALVKQLAKAGPLNKTALAHQAFAGRVRWSEKLRQDHRSGQALEKFMAKWYQGRVPVQHVGKGLGVLAILVGAGVNAQVLGRVADHSKKYCQTRRLCERYGMPLPVALSGMHPEGFADEADMP